MEIKINKNKKVKVSNSKDIYLIMRQILLRENKISRAQEHFWMVGLDQVSKILYIELVALGSANSANIRAREAFRLAIYKLAVKVILVHNHPSGELMPSNTDKDFTDYYIQAGKFLNVKVIDHLIINEKEYFSFADTGIMDVLINSKKYVLPFELEEKARKEKAIAMVKVLKQKGIDLLTIMEASGLSEKEIKDL